MDFFFDFLNIIYRLTPSLLYLHSFTILEISLQLLVKLFLNLLVKIVEECKYNKLGVNLLIIFRKSKKYFHSQTLHYITNENVVCLLINLCKNL